MPLELLMWLRWPSMASGLRHARDCMQLQLARPGSSAIYATHARPLPLQCHLWTDADARQQQHDGTRVIPVFALRLWEEAPGGNDAKTSCKGC